MSDAPAPAPYPDSLAHLDDELRRLDLLIHLWLSAREPDRTRGAEFPAPRVTGVSRAEVDRLLAADGSDASERSASGDRTDALRAELAALTAHIAVRLKRSLADRVPLTLPALGHLFGLSDFELQVVVVCLAPELRRRYDRLYAYLQDDLAGQRPSVGLALDLLCESERERWAARHTFLDSAPLLRAGILYRVADGYRPSGSSGLGQFLAIEPRVCEFLLGAAALDARLAGVARLYRPAGDPQPPPVDAELAGSVLNLVEHHVAGGRANRRALVLHLYGPAGVGRRALAGYACHRIGVALLAVDLEALAVPGTPAEDLLRLAFREALLQQAAVYLSGFEVLRVAGGRPLLKSLAVVIAEFGWLVFLGDRTPWTVGDVLGDVCFQPVAVPVPDVPLRTAIWRACLSGRPDHGAWAPRLGAQFRLSPSQIRAAAAAAEGRALMRSAAAGAVTLADLTSACRAQSDPGLGRLAVKLDPRRGWRDIVLPEGQLAQLREICGQVRHRYQVMTGWGFGDKLGRGTGLSVLFTGAPGTGKTMAAEVVARELDLDLYQVDLSGVVSKYVGETEKNLSRVFDEARSSNAILFFDEADALFGKRTEVSDAHDRYANVEISYLLQKMEEHDGIVILATNLRQNMDEAFTRRIRFVVEFPFPEADGRLLIWRALFPAKAPVADGVDLACLARDFPLAGGSIKNIVLHAAFLAAADGTAIGQRHLLRGTRREFEKLGKLWTEPDPSSRG